MNQNNLTNLLYFMSPYKNFDWIKNPLVLVFDRHGSALVNLRNSEVNQNHLYEDQAFYVGTYSNQ